VKEKETNKKKQAGRASRLQAPLPAVRAGQSRYSILVKKEEKQAKENQVIEILLKKRCKLQCYMIK